MSAEKHWKWDGYRRVVVSDIGLGDVADIVNPDHGPLIAAAPDLLDALEYLFDRCEEMRLNYTDPRGVGAGMKVARRAIARAHDRHQGELIPPSNGTTK